MEEYGHLILIYNIRKINNEKVRQRPNRKLKSMKKVQKLWRYMTFVYKTSYGASATTTIVVSDNSSNTLISHQNK